MECKKCEKRLSLVEQTFSCKCLNYYCTKCFNASKHGCQFEYNKNQKKRLTKDLVKIVSSKIEKI